MLVAAVAVLAAGCGGDSTSSGSTSSSTAAPVTASAGPEPSAACEDGGTTAAPESLTVEVDGTERTALVHVPPVEDPGEPLPAVLTFHGVSGSGAVQSSTDGLTTLADEEGFVVVHPEGLTVGLNDEVTGITGWDADGSEVDEVAFVEALLDELGTQVCVDGARTYATGFSAGANIALVIACALPERIAAVAPVSAAYQPGECEGAPPMPTFAFHGLDDIVTPFEGRDTPEAGTLLAARDVLDAQAERNGCDAEPEVDETAPSVQTLTWTGCDAPTVLHVLDDHGHAWPGHPMPFDRELLLGLFAGSATQPPDPLTQAIGATPEEMADNVLLTNVEIDATEAIWEHFSSVG